MTYLIYIGKGKGTIPGVPARDLSFEETLLYGPGDLIRSGLYVRKPEPKPETVVRIVEDTEQPEPTEETTEEQPRRYRRRKEN